MIVLNVGGGPSRALPRHFLRWEQHLLDIDPAVQPDLVCDAREMTKLPARRYDAVFCSHCLEHFHRHEVPAVLGGFRHVLKTDGFAQIAVPDMDALMQQVVHGHRDIEDVWYVSPGGPISFLDVLYGWSAQVRRGNLYYCHKTAFTATSLTRTLRRADFRSVFTASDGTSLHAYAFRRAATKTQRAALGI